MSQGKTDLSVLYLFLCRKILLFPKEVRCTYRTHRLFMLVDRDLSVDVSHAYPIHIFALIIHSYLSFVWSSVIKHEI